MNLRKTSEKKFIQKLKLNTPISLIECIKYKKVPNSPGIKCKENIIEESIIKTFLFTDGNVVNITNEIVENVNDFNFNEKEHKLVDIKKTKYVYLCDYTYVVVYLVSNEWMAFKNCAGMVDVIKNISIYLKDKKDKKALENAKKIIKINYNDAKKIDYSSVFSFLMTSIDKKVEDFNEEFSKGIYLVKKNSNKHV